MSINEIVDGVSYRNQAAAVPALPGATSIQKVAGALKSVDDQGTATDIGGGGTVSTSGSISGNGTAGSPILSTKLNAILNLARGADIPDADTTINPGTDKASEYHVPGPLTANRVLTIANGGSPMANQQVVIVNYDTSAFTLTVKNATTATIFIFSANPGVGVIRWELAYFGTNYNHNLSGYAQAS